MTNKNINLNVKYQRTTNLMFYAFSSFMFIIILWAFIFQVDIVSNADGQVIPQGEIKTVQHLEGGIIEKILVKESEYVETGQPLVILAATASEVDVEELQVRMDTQIIKSIRLEAEINNFDTPIFPSKLTKKREKIINKSMELFISRQKNFEGSLKEFDASVEKAQTDVDILLRQAEMSQQLMEEQVTSEFAHLNILKELNNAKGMLEETIEKKENYINQFVEDSRNELQIAQRELSQSEETMKKLKDNLNRTTITAPVDGVVKNLFFVTEGGVIKPGGSILDLVPTRDSLIVEARLPNSDIGFVQIGQEAVVKLSSADSVNFGQINGRVIQISPDTEEDEDDKRIVFYKILVETDQNYFESKGRIYQLVPGVKVIASIYIGQRSVANYLLSPFIDTMETSLQER